VLPASFRFLRASPDVLLPMRLERVDFMMFDFQAVARLKPGVTLSQANADIARMIPLLEQGHERINEDPPQTSIATGTAAAPHNWDIRTNKAAATARGTRRIRAGVAVRRISWLPAAPGCCTVLP
jgi:hypothetical protein